MYTSKRQKKCSEEDVRFLFRSYLSRHEFVEEYQRLYNLKTKAKRIHCLLLRELTKTIVEGNVICFKELSNIFTYIYDVEGQETLEDSLRCVDNPIKNSNLVILACKHNQVEILAYLFNNGTKILNNLSVGIGRETILPNDQDEMCHNAFYYAIRSGNLELLDTLINKWPGNYFVSHVKQLDEVLSKAYEELKLKNVPLTVASEIFIEDKLINLRFYSNTSRQTENVKYKIENIQERIVLVLENIRTLTEEYSDKKVDDTLLFIAKFIAQNVHVLKRQLKSSYSRLPWEEIEFCLICFVTSQLKTQECNIFYQAVLSKDKILSHLENFAKVLENEKTELQNAETNNFAELPKLRRENVISEIIHVYPQFKNLYEDYELIRDICSLEKMNKCIELAASADPKEKEGQLVIIRALQVIGEYLKNTLESPKVSNITGQLLLQLLPKNTRRVIIDLRNSLSHMFSLSRRAQVEENAEVDFFMDIQNDTKKAGDVIAQILHNNRIKAIRILLKKVIDSENVEEIKEISAVFINVEFSKFISGNFETIECEKLEKLVNEFSDSIVDKTNFENELFSKISNVIQFMKTKLDNASTDYLVGVGFFVVSLKTILSYNIINQNIIKIVKFNANQILEKIAPKIQIHNLKEITKLARAILHSVLSKNNNDFDEVSRLFCEIVNIAEFGSCSIKWIESLGEKINKKCSYIPSSAQDKCNQKLTDKVSELKSILQRNVLLGQLDGKLISYKNDDKLQAATEMLVLDIMSILGEQKNSLENNLLFVDESTPVLTGNCLRNHLAHDNNLVNILLSDSSIAVLLNARKLTAENVTKRRKKIGKFVPDAPSNVKAKYDHSLFIVNNQKRLFVALEQGNAREVEICLQRGADLYARSWKMQTTLHFAAKGSSLEIVKFVVEQGIDINAKDNNHQNALHIAAFYGRTSIVEYLIGVGLHVDCRGLHLKTPLHLAAQNGKKDTIEVLLKSHAKTTVRDLQGYSPLHFAVQNNHIDAVHVLIEKEEHVDHNEAMGGFTPLHIAAERGHLKLVKYFLENNANVNAQTDHQVTPLHLSALNGYFEVVKVLISKHADVCAKSLRGGTPLLNAVEHGHREIAETLIKHGANVNAAYKIYNITPLHHAAKGGYVKILNNLLKNGADARVANSEGISPLHFAAGYGHVKVVNALLRHGVDIEAKDVNNAAPLHYATAVGQTQAVNFLIENGADVNVKTVHGITPLHVAAMEGCKDIVGILVKKKARVDVQDANGFTPLHSAAMHGRKDIIDVLIRNGCDVDAENNWCLTPLHLAACSGSMRSADETDNGITSSTFLAEIDHSGSFVFQIKNNVLATTASKDSVSLQSSDHRWYRETVAALLKNKARVNARTDGQIAPLHTAACGGNKDIVCNLIQNGAEVNASATDYSTPLWTAVESGHKEIVEILLAHQANINLMSKNMTLLSYAVRNNHNEIVEILIANGSDVNANDGDALQLASLAGYRDIAELLLKSGACVNVTSPEELTPLHLAATQGHTSLVNCLLAAGAEVNAQAAHAVTPLFAAAQRGYEEIAEILIANGAEVNIKASDDITSLHVAALNGHCNVVRVLLNNKAKVYVRDHKNRTALDFAVFYGHLQVVKTFLQYKHVDVNAKNNNAWTLLHTASQEGHLEMVKYLIGKGSDINARNSAGSKPVHIAARDGHKDIVELFLNKGISIDDRGAVDQTLLHYAVLLGQSDIVRFLIARGSDVNAKDCNGMSPLHIAAPLGNKNVIDMLLKNGGVYNSVDIVQRTPLQIAIAEHVIDHLSLIDKLFEAVKSNCSSEVEKCIKAGAYVDVKDIHVKTPLYFAVWKGYDRVVDTLLQHKANPNTVDAKGFTPLHYAAKFSHLKIVKALLSKGAIYNVASHSGKTPSDLTTDKDVASVLKLVGDTFRSVENGNSEVILDINKIEDTETVRTVMYARNTANRSLVATAMYNNFLKVEEFKHISKALVFQGNFQGALHLLRSVLELLGTNDPETLDIQREIAEVLFKQGRDQEALEVSKEILEKQRGILGESDKDVLSTRILIARIFYSQKKYEGAYEIYQDVYRKQQEVLGPNHSDTLDSLSHVVLLLERLGKYEDALRINNAMLKGQIEILGENHLHSLPAQHNLATSLASEGKLKESLEIYREVFEKEKDAFGINNRDTLRTLHNIAVVLMNLRKYQEALHTFEDVLNTQKNVLGPNDPETLQTQHNMGLLFFCQGRWISALKVYKKCFNQMKAEFGASHPDVLEVSNMIELINMRYRFDGSNMCIVLQHLQTNVNTAARGGDIQTIERMLEEGADVNDQDNDGWTPLHYAADNGQIGVVSVLLKYGADATQVNNKGNTPLHTAASKGYKEIIEVLLQNVSTGKVYNFINAKTTSGGTTALHVAAGNGFLDIVKCLLNFGAVYNIENKEHKTPLDISKDQHVTDFLKLVQEVFENVKSGNTGVIEQLKPLKPDEFASVTRAHDKQGRTLLQAAITNKCISISCCLVEMIKS